MPTPIEDTLIREQDRIGERIYKKSFNSSVWNKLVPKEAWPDGLSDTIQVLTMERNLPDNIDEWEVLAPNEDTNNCVPTADVVPTGQTLRSYNLVQKALESQEICVNDVRNAFRTSEQIRLMYENLTGVIRYTWKRRAMLEYARVCEHKMIAAPGLPENSASFPAIAATSILRQQTLNKIYMELIADSAEEDGGSLGYYDSRPAFILITDAETSDSLVRESATTQAMLWNQQGLENRAKDLLSPLGVSRAIRGFYHTIENLPRRFNFVNGAYVEVMPYETAAATKGTKSKISAEYRAAQFTMSHVYLPTVMSFMVPQPISTMGSGTNWKPQSYMGDFKWMNIQHRTDNPDNALGFYRAVIQTGTKPVHPEFGYSIIHLRCPTDLDLAACPSGFSGDSADLGSGDSFFV
jgi:hypothetical protein